MGTVEDYRDISRIWGGNSQIAAGLGLVKGVDPNVVILPIITNTEMVGITITSQIAVRDTILLRRHGICRVLVDGNVIVGDELILGSDSSSSVFDGRFVALSQEFNINQGDSLNVCGKALTASTGQPNFIFMQVYKRVHVELT